MFRFLFLILIQCMMITPGNSQDMVSAARKWMNTLDAAQKVKALYPFESEERYSFHYFPINDRKGIPLDELNEKQRQLAMDLLRTCLTEGTVKKVKEIIQLEVVLKELEKRKPDDGFRDPGKYYVAVFGIPGEKTIWGWRFEGHHASFNFSADKKRLVSGTPGFIGSNPAIVQQGPQKGQEVLKEEKELGFALLNALSGEELKKALIDEKAPAEILTGISRKAAIEGSAGLSYSEMNDLQQQKFLQLINLYVHRYSKLFADNMLKEIQQAGLSQLRFAWAGFRESGIGKPHYYRIQGPTIIIEYDNTQNDANHVHTVVRDLLHDFGGDVLLEHYKADHAGR